jgi:ribosomal RNA-processing protein 17
MAPTSRRRNDGQTIQEINFDPAARYEYLTGFHKRKLQRTRQAREFAAKKDREEKREQRRKVSDLLFQIRSTLGITK